MTSFLLLAFLATPPLMQAEARPWRALGLPADVIAGPVVPGLRQDGVPQGLAWVRSANGSPRFLISHDRPDDLPSCVSVLDGESGALLSVVTLLEPDGDPHRGHVGGLAALGDRLFVASDGELLRYRLSDVLNPSADSSSKALSVRPDETEASYCTARRHADGDELWVGEFARNALFGKAYKTKRAHHLTDRVGRAKRAWVCRTSPANAAGRITGVLSVRQRVQGLCFVPADEVGGVGQIVLSVSYGRTNRSELAFYRDPTGEPAHRTVTIDGRDAPLWFLDEQNHLRTLDFPPMSEGVAFVPPQNSSKPRLAVLSESGGAKFQPGGRGPLDVIMLLQLKTQRRPSE